MYSPAAVWNRTLIVGALPRFTTSASKRPVTPSCTPMPIQRSRAPVLTARPSTPLGDTKSLTSGRYSPCHSSGITRAVAGTPDGPAVPERSSTAERNPKPTVSSGPNRA